MFVGGGGGGLVHHLHVGGIAVVRVGCVHV